MKIKDLKDFINNIPKNCYDDEIIIIDSKDSKSKKRNINNLSHELIDDRNRVSKVLIITI